MKIHDEGGDGAAERQAITAMITDSTVLGRISPKWNLEYGLFRSEYANILANLAVAYFREYDKAPGLHISTLFTNWAETCYDKATVELGSRFLAALNSEYDPNQPQNSEFLIDQASRHFRKVQMRRLIELVKSDLDTGMLDHAQSKLDSFGRLDLGTGKSVDVLRDTEAFRAAFQDHPEDDFIYLPGDYGAFFNGTLDRNQFVVFFAAMKRKKTFFLIDIGWRAMLCRRKVAFFEVGDLTQDQIIGRFGIRASRRPRWATTPERPIRWPIDIRLPPGEDQPAQVDWQEKHFDDNLGWRSVLRACHGIIRNHLHSNEEFLKLITVPSRSLSAKQIRDYLDRWAREGFVADVVIVDYVDILAPLNKHEEHRDSVNSTWQELNAIRQEKHCLMLTATQTNAKSFDAKAIDYSHFAEDNRKMATLTAGIGINETKAEKEIGLVRLNMFIAREVDYDPRHFLHCAGCLPLANPIVRSIW